jgi:FtsZ-interacting cell division protein ZipA
MRTLLLLVGIGAIALLVLSLWRRTKGRGRRDRGDDTDGGRG